jgi:short-subunit dehydrogenase
MDYRGKVVVITGASSGIGRDAAVAFAKRGAIVVGVARREALLVELADECKRHASDASYLAGDLGERAFAERVVHDTVARHGRLDVLINNAGIPIHKQIYDVTPEDMDLQMRVNFMASVWTTLAAIPYLLRQGEGYVVNVSSMAAKVAPPRETPYTAAKAAMDGFTAGLWSDLAGSGIHVALVVPGPIDTEIWSKDDSPSAYAGPKYPPKIVTDAIFEVIEKRIHERVVPRFSAQLVSAHLLRFFAPSLLLRGMAWMEPVAPDVIAKARARAVAATRGGSGAPGGGAPGGGAG